MFWILLLATFVWQFLPEYLFPFVASLAPLCWFASRNHTVNFIGAGRGGMGLLNITLNWSNITSTVVTYPYSVQVIIFLAFVLTVSLFHRSSVGKLSNSLQCWILIPIAYFGNLWGSPTYDIMSNEVFQKNGSAYPLNDLSMYLYRFPMMAEYILIRLQVYVDSGGMQHVNETRYEEVGLAYSGAQYTWQIFMVKSASNISRFRLC